MSENRERRLINLSLGAIKAIEDQSKQAISMIHKELEKALVSDEKQTENIEKLARNIENAISQITGTVTETLYGLDRIGFTAKSMIQRSVDEMQGRFEQVFGPARYQSTPEKSAGESADQIISQRETATGNQQSHRTADFQ